jgi:hypothetical protein
MKAEDQVTSNSHRDHTPSGCDAWTELAKLEPMIRKIQQAGAALFAVAESGSPSDAIEPAAIFHFADWIEDHAEEMWAQWERCLDALRLKRAPSDQM